MKRIVQLVIMAGLAVCLFLEARQVSDLRGQVAALQQRCDADSTEMATLNADLTAAKRANGALGKENWRLATATSESEKLRAELNRLHGPLQSDSKAQDPFEQMVNNYIQRAVLLNQRLQEMPAEKIPEIDLLDADDWLAAAKNAKLDTDADVRQSLSKLREIAKNKLPFGSGLYSYTRANDGNLPTDMSQLAPYLRFPVDNSILARYSIVQQGNVSTLAPGTWVILENSPVDQQYDGQAEFGIGTSTVIDIGNGGFGIGSQ
jgi:hypothetical protein